MKSILEQLELHEGFSKYPYKDTEGYLTIGYGWNLDRNGLPEDICKELTKRKVCELYDKLNKFEWFFEQDDIRRKVLLDMSYNLGINGLLKFKKMIGALGNNNYNKAAHEMLDSKWAKQVKTRAKRLAKMMETGEDYD